MQWLQTLDLELFRFINLRLSNPVFDAVMPFASGNALFGPLAFLGAILLIWKGGARGLLCLLMLALAVGVTDGLVCNTLKHAIGRERPFLAVPEAICLVGKGSSGSLPSSHAANWFAATMIAFMYYRRSLRFTLPLALVVCLSRVYNGVHYPSDVVAGAILGAGCAGAVAWSLHAFWQWAGRKWFPIWWEGLPFLLDPELGAPSQESRVLSPKSRALGPRSTVQSPHADIDQHWLRLGYVLIAALLGARLAYIASGTIQLSFDEAYQWLWSKHLALSYYSKPPLIAYTQFLGTSLWGDNEFGVRFFSPVIAAILSLLGLRFFAREVNARAGFFLLLILTATVLMSAGAVLMTIDPLSVLFWTAAMLSGWRAIQDDAGVRPWLWVGLWMGLGFLSKATELFQFLCWAVFFALWPPARKHLRRPGPYLALLIHLVCALPVLIWNAQRHWPTLGHLAENASLHTEWKPTLKYFAEFLGSEAGLLNPIFFVGMVWAAIAFWRRGRHNPLLVYLFSMGAPLFLCYLLYSFRARILPNWVAPSVLPLFCLMVIYWDTRWRLGVAKIKGWLIAGLSIGYALVMMGYQTDLWRVSLSARHGLATYLPAQDTNLIALLNTPYLPVKLDPLHRLRAWEGVAQAAGLAREQLLAEGKPVFIIGDSYQLAGIISFYLPEAKACVSQEPLVYCRSSPAPENQFYFWPGYSNRIGQSAIYVLELDRNNLLPLAGLPWLTNQFDSITDLGIREVIYHGQLCRPLQLFACRGLR
jgi:4-amino-4-deoxy-L-arabinose transferase-like glycosyltransferase/membrane-associated phospholipid phosphatase